MHRFGYDFTHGGVIKLSFAQVFNKFYSFYEELEHAC